MRGFPLEQISLSLSLSLCHSSDKKRLDQKSQSAAGHPLSSGESGISWTRSNFFLFLFEEPLSTCVWLYTGAIQSGELKRPSACFAQNLRYNASHSTHVLKSHMVAHCMARGLAKRTPALEQKVATLFPGDRGWFELIYTAAAPCTPSSGSTDSFLGAPIAAVNLVFGQHPAPRQRHYHTQTQCTAPMCPSRISPSSRVTIPKSARSATRAFARSPPARPTSPPMHAAQQPAANNSHSARTPRRNAPAFR